MDFGLFGVKTASTRNAMRTVIAIMLIASGPVLCAEKARADEGDNAGPVRLARFSYVSGSVTWHYGDDDSWSDATRNMPLRQGAQIWTSDSSRAEVEFDDGARLRLDSNTLVTLQTLYSDEQGEFTEITLGNGSVHMHLKNKYSIYQVNTPFASLKAAGPARFRVTAGNSCQFEQFFGTSTVESNAGSVTLQRGQALYLSDADAPYRVVGLPSPDDWDTWNAARDARIDNPDRNQYVPSDIALVCDDLDKHGSWHHDRQYGWVWAPTVTDADWRPYGAGSWTWVEPFGWTWVSTDSWGWAPYHYGSWVHADFGWGWVPGPAHQYWCPAVVSFHQVNGGIAWVPLAPHEVRYPPSISLGFHSGNWSAFFSIGGAAVYYPANGSYCEPRPWTSTFVNHAGQGHTHNSNNPNTINIHNTYVNGSAFKPGNANFGGGTFVNSQEFTGVGKYQPVRVNQASVIFNGRTMGAPVAGQRPKMALLDVPPTAATINAGRTLVARPPIPQSMAARPVFRAPLPASIAQTPPAQSAQRTLTLNPARPQPKPTPRDGSGFTTPLRTGPGNSAPPVPRGGSNNPFVPPTPVRRDNSNPPPQRNPVVSPPAPVNSPPARGGGNQGGGGSAPPPAPVRRENPAPPQQQNPVRTPPTPVNNPPAGGGNRGGGSPPPPAPVRRENPTPPQRQEPVRTPPPANNPPKSGKG